MISAYEELTAQSALFQLFADDQRKRIQAIAEIVHYAPGHPIISQGHEDTDIFLVRSGEVEVSTVREGRETQLARLGAGAMFGEVAGIGGVGRTASVKAMGEVEVVRFPGPDFLAVVRSHPRAESVLKKIVSRRAEDTLDKTLK